MKKSFDVSTLKLSRPVFLVEGSVMVDYSENTITAKALFPSSDPSLADRKDGHVNLQHFDALGSNLFHALVAATRGGTTKTVRVVSIEGAEFFNEVKQDVQIDAILTYVPAATGYSFKGKPLYAGFFSASVEGKELFRYNYRVVMW